MRAPIYYRSFDYDRRLLPNPYLAELESGVTSIEEARLKTGLTIGYPAWGAMYYLSLCALNPGEPAIVVETGSNWGCSTIVLASALIAARADGHIHTIEIDPGNAAKARDNYARAGVADLITLHEGDTRDVLPRVLSKVESISVAFLDGGHTQELIAGEFSAVVPKLKPQGIVLMDNTYNIAEPGEDQRVHGFLRSLLSEKNGNVINLPFCSWYTPGLAVWQKAPFPG